MALRLLPDLTYPITSASINALMDNVVQLNTTEGCLADKQQRALALSLHAIDLYVKTKGRVDYRGADGHKRMFEDAMKFCGSGNPIPTKHGELAAAHLAIDYHDTQIRCKLFGLPPIPTTVSQLIVGCSDLELAPEYEKRIGLLLDYWSKKPMI